MPNIPDQSTTEQIQLVGNVDEVLEVALEREDAEAVTAA